MYHTTPSDQSHQNCPGQIYVGDGYVTDGDGDRVWGPKFAPCGTCEIIAESSPSITTRVDPFALVRNPRELGIPF